MEDDLPEWTIVEYPPYLEVLPGSEPESMYVPYIRRGENEKPDYTPEEEERLIKEQFFETNGYDIDFKQFRCIFNFLPVNFDDNHEDIVMEPETTRDLMERLSRGFLERYNKKKDTKYEFVEAIKANFHSPSASNMFYITFEGKDPYNGQPKLFQARVCYFFHTDPLYISCNLKPDEKERTIRKICPYIKYLPGSEPKNAYIPYIRRGENEGPDYTPEEEEVLMYEYVCKTGGFDIDFKQFHCIFNYLPLNFDDDNNEYIFVKSETTRELMDRLSRGSLEKYNKDQRSYYEFVKAIKANFYMTSDVSVMFYITFEGKDPCYGQPEHFQARVCYYYHDPPVYISCCVKQYNEIHFVEIKDKDVKKSSETADKDVKKFTETAHKGVEKFIKTAHKGVEEFIETAEKGAKKPRLTEKLSNV